MRTFKAVCVKNNQKIELVLQYQTIDDAKEDLHKQGYGVISIEEVQADLTNQGKAFYFEIYLDGKKKSGKIFSSDVLKAYIKLVDELKYDIVSIYEDIDTPEQDKPLILGKVRESYRLYRESKPKLSKDEEKKKLQAVEAAKPKNHDSNNLDGNILKKSVDRYLLKIDLVIQAFEDLLSRPWIELTQERKEKIQNAIIVLKQVKTTTNIEKIKSVAEASILKMYELQQELLSHDNIKDKNACVLETNRLLKEIGSGKRMHSENEALEKIKRISRDVWRDFLNKLTAPSKDKKEKQVDFTYFSKSKELEFYQQKLQEVNIRLIKAYASFQFSHVEALSLRKRLIVQNIEITKKRINDLSFSYTMVVKWVRYFDDVLIYLSRFFWDVVIYGLFAYVVFFLLYKDLSYVLHVDAQTFNHNSLYLVVILCMYGLLSRFITNFVSMLGIAGFFTVFLIYLWVNF